MFEELKKYKKIIVTGPQRSGTRICAHIISEDTGHKYIDEVDYGIKDKRRFSHLLQRDNIVVHAPAMSFCIDEYGDEDTLIIFMKRDIEDIIKSQERINWGYNEQIEKISYGILTEEPISKIKYKEWERQKKKIKHYKETEYNSLKQSELWVGKEDRKKFTAYNQWRQNG